MRKRVVSAEASIAMLAHPLDSPRLDENQLKDFFGEIASVGRKLWSKSGETSDVRHDAAYAQLPSGRKLIIVILARASEKKALLPRVGRHLLAAVSN